jgi:CRP-like cAMP-binding protein
VQQGAMGNEMYFIKSGQLDVLINDKVIRELGEGNYFGGNVFLVYFAISFNI